MKQNAREARLDRIEQLFDAAYRLARMDNSSGFIEIDGQRKRPSEWRHNALFVQLLAANPKTPPPFPEMSNLQITSEGRTVLNVRWDDDGAFEVVTFKRGEWERELNICAAKSSQAI